MTSLNIEQNYFEFERLANRFLSQIGPRFTETANGHIQTDIAGTASMAGLAILRSIVPNLDNFKPGEAILADVHAHQETVHAFMVKVAHGIELDPRSGWDEKWSQPNAPLLPVHEMTRRLEPSFNEILSTSHLGRACGPFVGALAAMKLAAAGEKMKLLPQAVGKSLALYHVIAGSKTVPYPVGTQKRSGFWDRIWLRRKGRGA